ncbi:IS3 family transposase [Bacillus testis]|uniref:IS3 family transposase n=1 Tax=Bacillus testis TaxID=1622072 RepID=UPI0011C6EB8A|nr:IS3 family transposase [Bacillus testis]
MARSKHPYELKLTVLDLLSQGHTSLRELSRQFQVSHKTIKRWKIRYETFGEEALREATTWTQYPKELKMAAVQTYLDGGYSLTQVIAKYGITSESVLRRWINQYTSHSELKDSGKGMSQSMTKGRKTTLQERLDIVSYCLSHQKDYQLTAEIHQVSYYQVYSWTKKFEEEGEEGLRDKRGRTKSEAELTPDEKMRLQMRRLEKENERLRAENLFFKKVRGNRKEASLAKVRHQSHYQAIQELHEKDHLPILLLCEIAGVSRAAYYKWLQRSPSKRETENRSILEEIQAIYTQVNGIYGYRRVALNINRKRQAENKPKVNVKRIYRLMNIRGLKSVIRRKRKRYVSSPAQHLAENRLNREFTADKPNEKWVTDVTELKYGQSQKAYLSAILDLYDGSIVSYVLSHSNNNPLVFDTLNQAISSLKEEKPLIHSDRGYQYTSHGFKEIITKAKLTHSMSRVGKCIDNGPMESFWGTLKCEKYYLHTYKTYEALQKAIDEYIDFYNNDRFQKRLNGLSPLEFRAQAA